MAGAIVDPHQAPSSPPFKGGVAAASADGVVVFSSKASSQTKFKSKSHNHPGLKATSPLLGGELGDRCVASGLLFSDAAGFQEGNKLSLISG